MGETCCGLPFKSLERNSLEFVSRNFQIRARPGHRARAARFQNFSGELGARTCSKSALDEFGQMSTDGAIPDRFVAQAEFSRSDCPLGQSLYIRADLSGQPTRGGVACPQVPAKVELFRIATLRRIR